MLKSIKIFKNILIVLILLIFTVSILSIGKNYSADELSYGVTFSDKYSRYLVGDKWQDNFISALDDLGIRKFRIPAYWDEIQENNPEEFDYSNLDWMINEAEKRDSKIIIAVGYRLPRWPECHIPDWAKEYSQNDEEEKILSYIKETVNRYKNNKSIYAWQIENEPFLRFFGECPSLEKNFLEKEISLVKELDNRPIIITDSGELSIWVQAASRADIFGTSIYLNTYSQALKSYIHYPIGPWFFHLKKNLASIFAKPDEWIVIEMQAEPWGKISLAEMSEKEKSRTMDLKKFREMISFGQKAGFREFYLWGVEWWYWEKEINNNSVFWDEAKKLYTK